MLVYAAVECRWIEGEQPRRLPRRSSAGLEKDFDHAAQLKLEALAYICLSPDD
jgi:hypothetical protein